MLKFRVSVFAVLALFVISASTATAQLREGAKYTTLPGLWEEEIRARELANWAKKAYLDPVTTLKEEPKELLAFLDKRDWDLKSLLPLNAPSLRAELGAKIVEKAIYDPFFLLAVDLARTESTDRMFLVQTISLLNNVVTTYLDDYPAIAPDSRQALLDRLADAPDEIKFLILDGLALLKNDEGSNAVTLAVLKELSTDSEPLLGAAAHALARIGDKSAVAPLMEKLLALPADEESGLEDDDDSGPAGMQINKARLQIALSVSALTGIDWTFSASGKKSDVVEKYDNLAKWWQESKGQYE